MGWQDAPLVGSKGDDSAFRSWYGFHAKKLGLDPDPDNPEHYYDWRAAYRSGAKPDKEGHWPSEFKQEGHPNLIIDGMDTRTGQPAAKRAAWESAPIVEDAPQAQPAGAGRNTSPSTIGPLPWYQKDVVGGVSVQDALNALPVIGGAVGGMVGGAGGTAFGAGFGGVPGAVGGAALGGAGGEAANQLARRAVGIGGVPTTPEDAAKRIGVQGAVQGGAEGLGRGVAAVGRSVAAPVLRKAAEIQYGRALNATTKPLKNKSRQIVPELLDKRVSGSLETLAEKGAAKSATAGRALDRAYTGASARGVITDTTPIMQSLGAMKNRFLVTGQAGQSINTNPAAVARIEALENLIGQFGGGARPDQLWKLRKNVDDIIKAGNGFNVDLTPGTIKSIQKEVRTIVQKELNKASPDIAALNKQFSLWKGLEDVARATMERKQGQSGIVELGIRSTLGGAGGLLMGDDPAWGPVGALLGIVSKSPRWRTLSAVHKARLAHALSKGQTATAASALAHVATLLGVSESPEQSTTSPAP